MTTVNKQRNTRIRNGKLRRDFSRLLAIIAWSDGVTFEHFAEVEEIAKRNGLYYDDDGNVKEVRE